MNLVHILDHVVLPTTEVNSWIRRWRTEYLPGARERGMRSVHLWRSHPAPDAVTIDILWELRDPYAFYGMRGAAAADPDVARFWADTDAIAISRDRRALQAEAHAEDATP
ncbi:hypothetical protein ACQP0C_25280 [Nocardia sp. CA-129566]|uniref:hypothetical protein n=1 Tax=Nocardia sp. CA-129566 TaxID=3239976 RepID=UPI003D997A92